MSMTFNSTDQATSADSNVAHTFEGTEFEAQLSGPDGKQVQTQTLKRLSEIQANLTLELTTNLSMPQDTHRTYSDLIESLKMATLIIGSFPVKDEGHRFP